MIQKITIPDTNLQVSRLGFGTSSLHHVLDAKARDKLISNAIDIGFTHFDTAPLYGHGLAETTLGNSLKFYRHKITIATKIGIPYNPVIRSFPGLMYAQKGITSLSRKISGRNIYLPYKLSLNQREVEKSLYRSLSALKTDFIDILFIHQPQNSDAEKILRIAEWLKVKKDQGVVRYLGLAGEPKSCSEISKKIPGIFDILQVEDSIENHDADVVVCNGFQLQVTFGYIRNNSQSIQPLSIGEVLKIALVRNSKGMILVSSRNLKRLEFLASLV